MPARTAAAQAVAVMRLPVGSCPLIVYLPVSDRLVDAISPKSSLSASVIASELKVYDSVRRDTTEVAFMQEAGGRCCRRARVRSEQGWLPLVVVWRLAS